MRRFAIALISLGLVAACGDEGAVTTSTSTTVATTTSTTTTAPSTSTTTGSTTTITFAPVPVEACRLPELAFMGVGLGFPRSTDRLASTGTVDAAVLFADFSDIPADRIPEDVLAILSPGAEERYAAMSYGRMQLVLHPYPAWIRLAGDSAHYAEAIRSSEGHRAFLQEAMDLADGAVDFSGMEVVVVMSAPNAAAIGYGPAFVGYPGGGLVADGVEITNGITSGADLLYWGAAWLNHEMGHSMTLADLYSFAEPTGFTRPFSLMDQIDSEAPEYFAYERWLLGWIDDDQILCQTWAEGDTYLTAVEVPGGTKAVIVPIGTSRAVVVESRRAIGYDAALSRVGAVVYVVDTSIPSGSGPIQVMNDRQALLPGESVTVEGVTVTVIAADELGDTVRTVVG